MVFIRYTVFVLASVLLTSVQAQTTSAPSPSVSTVTVPGTSPLPLTQYSFTYPNLPEKVNPFDVARGPQSGYNICNSTTEGPTSQCQTMFVNSIDDFCLWGSPTPNGEIGNVEAIVVAYCTKAGHGTRVMPPGTLTAVQFMKAPGYIQVTGLMNQSGIGLDATDEGGELDPHGADLDGNPLGGLLFSNNLPSSKDNTTIIQVKNWSNFVGGDQFCIKACDPTITAPDFCQNIFDTEGCFFNMPASYTPDQFTSCEGDNQLPPGNSPPVIPASSSCTTYTSSLLYPSTSTSTSATSTGTSGSASRTASSTSSRSGAPAATSTTSDATRPGAGLFTMVSTIVVGFVGMVVML